MTSHQTYTTIARDGGYEGFDRVLNATPYDELTSAQLKQLAEHFQELHERREGEINARTVVTPEADRVAAGMAWLDKHYPDHVERMDLETLHVMGWPSHNENGTVYRDCALVKAAEMGWVEATLCHPSQTHANWGRMGFTVPFLRGESFRDEKIRTEKLNQAWIDAYQSRRSQGK